MTSDRVTVVGGGLAGCETAWQLARHGVPVRLVEMRPHRTTPAHRSDHLAELVCSNSLRGDSLVNAVGLLKREMEALDSLVIRVARENSVPAGGALAVDRERFGASMTAAVHEQSLISITQDELTELPEGPAVIATGPLTTPAFHKALDSCLGDQPLSFFDAIAPIVVAESLDHESLFAASRYEKGAGDDYLNAAMDRQQYEAFVEALLAAEKVPFRDFETEDMHFFEGCLPIEVMAARGLDTMRYGPMKPVGLTDPATGRRPWAVVQLRRDDLAAEHWNLVGFQTKLTQGQQKRVFGLIPGLENARFARFGSVHRNTFINAPQHLDAQLRLNARPEIRLAGQITGVEGYVESAAVGLIAARFLLAERAGIEATPPPQETAMGGLMRHLSARPKDRFQPSNITWGLMACPQELRAIRNRRERRMHHAELALEKIGRWAESLKK